MSDTTSTSYGIAITCVQIPETLRNVPLPMEIVSASGAARRIVVTLNPYDSRTEPVSRPGRYLVRAELPSGRWISEETIVPEQASIQNATTATAVGTVQLDFSEAVPPRAASQASSSILDGLESLPQYDADYSSGVAKGLDSLSSVQLEYSEFVQWEVETSEDTIADELIVRPIPPQDLLHDARQPDSARLPVDLAVFIRAAEEQEPDWPPLFRAADGPKYDWHPLFVQATWPSSTGEPLMKALVVWPASLSSKPLILLPDADPGINTDAPPLLASVKSGENSVDALFAYIRSGALTSAQQIAPALIKQAERYLAEKRKNPLYAILAAYALLKVGSDTRQSWIANLADWFPGLPDGAIIYGWYLIHGGQADQAKKYFQQALNHGLPIYSEGVRLLRDGLNFLHGLYPDDTQVRHDAALTYRIAAVANFESELTCLRLGKGLDLRS